MAKKNKNMNNANIPSMGVVPPAGMNTMGGIPSQGMYPPPTGMNSQGIYPGMPSMGIPSQGMYAPPGGIPSQGMPPMGVPSQGMYTGTSTTTTTFSTGVVGAPPVAPPAPAPADAKGKKGKKDKKGKKGKAPANEPVDISKFTPEQLAQYQLDEALRESSDPASRLRKLKSPISVGGCLLMLLMFVLITIVAVFIICWIMVDRFNPLTLGYDMLDKFGIIKMFQAIGNWFKGLFGGGGSEAVGMVAMMLGL